MPVPSIGETGIEGALVRPLARKDLDMGRYEGDELSFLMREDGGRNPYMPSAEELEAMAIEKAKGEIEKIRDPFKRVEAMRESGVYTVKEIKNWIASLDDLQGSIHSIGHDEMPIKTRLIKANGDLYGYPQWMEPEPEPEPLPTSEELYGETATITITNDDGTSFTRPASPEEVKRMRRKEILAIKDPKEQLRAIAENRDAFK